MDGQMTIDEYLSEQKQFSCTAFFEDGYSETREYDKGTDNLHLWDDLKSRHGILVNFKMNRGGLEELAGKKFRTPCHGLCDVECWSLACFLKRGYIRHEGKWVRYEDGTIMRAKNRECEWDPKEG